MTSTSVARTVGAILGIACLGDATATGVLRDGNWWLKTDREERIGYLAGYMDCGAYDARDTRLERGSWYNLEPKIDGVYRKEPSKRRLSVASVLLELAPRESIGSGVKRGERNPDKHGFFDGQYWKSIPPAHRLGFVEGYLDCWKNSGLSGTVFSPDAARYADRLSQWYGIKSDDPGAIRPDRASRKIADVLHELKD